MWRLLIFFTILIIACSSSQKISSEKFDAPLRQKLAQVEESSSEEPVQIIGKCTEPINQEMREKLAAAGISVNSVIKDIFTGFGSAKQIRKTAKLKFVSQLQLSVERQPKF
jgi:hypothetical protein